MSWILAALLLGQVAPAEAPSGFDTLTNGFLTQAEMDSARAVFSQREDPGVAHNHFSCVSCHFSPADGGAGHGIVELQVGRFANGVFSGRRIVHMGTTQPDAQERIAANENVRAQRTALGLFGAAFVECIPNSALQQNTNRSVIGGQRGELVAVPVLEQPGTSRVGRFGWKSQIASLHSFTKDADTNELGLNRPIDDPDILAITNFQRSLKVPPRGANQDDPQVLAGAQLFNQIGCAICHTPVFTTAPPGTAINGGAFRVPEALGSKTIRPFSDFALWDVGTGDGIVHAPAPITTRNKVRTAPLWGLRTRPLLFHDGRAITRNEAVLLHRNQASPAINAYRSLSVAQQTQILAFLGSL